MESKVFQLIKQEQDRQDSTVELIASENFVSENVLRAMGSVLTNKYSEGYPDVDRTGNRGRYYGGCHVVDKIEQYCCDKWREVFRTNYHVNVQPHSGSSANLAAYMSVLKPGDTILAMNLNNGGHLTHGSSVNFSGKLFNFVFYDVDENGLIDYDDLENKIYEYRPKMVVAGASAYSRIINFKRIHNIITTVLDRIADENIHAQRFNRDGECISDIPEDYPRPYFMVDMSHIAGLVAAGWHPSPFGEADIITTTTHKTLRGPRGGIIFCRNALAKKVDSAVFPGTQGGALQNVIAAKAIAAEEACTYEYKDYIRRVVENTRAMAEEFSNLGYNVVTGGTDNHLFLIDFSKTHPNLTGAMIQAELDAHGITVNKNCVPGEKRSPKETSGIRVGCAAMTTKGFNKDHFVILAHNIDRIIKKMDTDN